MLPTLVKSGGRWGLREPAFTNSRGWRDREHELAKPKDVQRLVAIGDSFTFGVEVDQHERFTDVLERRCARLEAINLGVNAYGTLQELRVLELEGLRYSPDYVVLEVFPGNDLEDIRTERRNGWPTPWCDLQKGDREELHFFPAEITWDVRLRTTSYLGELVFAPLDRVIVRTSAAPRWRDADMVPLFWALVRRIRALCDAGGARLLVVIAGSDDSRHEQIVAGFAPLGIESIDVREPLQQATTAGRPVVTEDGHWTAYGHEIVASLIATRLGLQTR
jgi:hypothetical protein